MFSQTKNDRNQSDPLCKNKKEFSIIKEESENLFMEQVNHFTLCQKMEQKLQRLRVFINSLENQKIKEQTLKFLKMDPIQFSQITAEFVLKYITDRVERYNKNNQIKIIHRNWKNVDIKVLIWIVCMYCQSLSIHVTQIHQKQDFWTFIASILPGANPQDCFLKWASEKGNKITQYKWTQIQEKFLAEIQKSHQNEKNKWKIISYELFLANKDPLKTFRTPKQCREHYISFLDPNLLRGSWTEEEKMIILTYRLLNKDKKGWSRISNILKGRTENAIKNRYYIIFNKLAKLEENKNKNELKIIEDYLISHDPQFEERKQSLLMTKQKQEKAKLLLRRRGPKSFETDRKIERIQNQDNKQRIQAQDAKITHDFKVQQNMQKQLSGQINETQQKQIVVKEQHMEPCYQHQKQSSPMIEVGKMEEMYFALINQPYQYLPNRYNPNYQPTTTWPFTYAPLLQHQQHYHPFYCNYPPNNNI